MRFIKSLLIVLVVLLVALPTLAQDNMPEITLPDAGIIYMGNGVDWREIGAFTGRTLAEFSDFGSMQYMGDPTYPGSGLYPDWHINSYVRPEGGTYTLHSMVIVLPTDEPEREWDTIAVYFGLDGEVYVLPFAYNYVHFVTYVVLQDVIRNSGVADAINELDATLALSHNQNPHPMSGMWKMATDSNNVGLLVMTVAAPPAPEGKEYLNCLNHRRGWIVDPDGWCVPEDE